MDWNFEREAKQQGEHYYPPLSFSRPVLADHELKFALEQ